MSSEKSLTPQIRFKGFTEAWEQRKLGEVFEYLSSQVQANQAQAEGRYKLFDASSQIGYSSIGSNRPLVTIIKDGSGVGRIRLIPYNSWFIGTLGGLLANEIDVDFGYALLQNIDFSIYIIGSTIPHIYFKDYSAAPLLIAKFKEQQMIGKVFSKLDSLITLHQRKLDTLKKIKSALLEKMFPKDSSNIPEIRFTGFTEAWEQRKFLTIYRKNDERNDAGLSADKTLSVATMTFNCDGNGASAESLPNYKRLRIGDVAFEGHTNKEFSFGRFVLNDAGDGIMSPRFTCLRPITKQDYSFWKHYIHSEKVMKEKLVNSTKSGTMMNELVVEDFLNESILIPSLKEQKKIGFIFKSLTNLITLHQRKLDALKKIKSALLEKMFV